MLVFSPPPERSTQFYSQQVTLRVRKGCVNGRDVNWHIVSVVDYMLHELNLTEELRGYVYRFFAINFELYRKISFR